MTVGSSVSPDACRCLRDRTSSSDFRDQLRDARLRSLGVAQAVDRARDRLQHLDLQCIELGGYAIPLRSGPGDAAVIAIRQR